MHLNPDSLSHFGEEPEEYIKIHPLAEKRVYNAINVFSSVPLPVAGVCVLSTGEKLDLRRLRGMEAVKEVLTHMIINRFPEKQPASLTTSVYNQSVELAKNIPVYRLTRPA